MIYLGADHGGFDLKEKMKAWLTTQGYAFEDLGNVLYEQEDDYPQFAFRVAEAVVKKESEGDECGEPVAANAMSGKGSEAKNEKIKWSDLPKGVLACRSAAGVVIAANKVPGIRAVAVTNTEMTRHAREHNDANVIALSGDWIDEHQIGDILEAFLTTEFTYEERHARRLTQIAAYEKGCPR